MNRREKISLLNSISKGKFSIKRLRSDACQVFIKYGRNNCIYKCEGKNYTQEEFDKMIAELSEINSFIVAIIPDNGRDRLSNQT